LYIDWIQYLNAIKPLHAERICDDVEDGLRDMNEREENEADKPPNWCEEKHNAENNALEEFAERPPYCVK
jgi:hypothetical protein